MDNSRSEDINRREDWVLLPYNIEMGFIHYTGLPHVSATGSRYGASLSWYKGPFSFIWTIVIRQDAVVFRSASLPSKPDCERV